MTGPSLQARFAAGVLRRRVLVLVAWAGAAAAAAWLLAHFRIDPDIASLFPKDDPTLRLTRHFQGDASPTRALLVVLRGPDAGTVDEAVPEVARRLRESPLLSRVFATRREFAGARYDWAERAPLYALPDDALDRLQARLTGPERRAEVESSLRRLQEDPLSGRQIVQRDPLGLRWIFDEAAGRLSSRFPAPLRAGSPHLVFEKPALAFLRAVGTEESYHVDFSQRLLEDLRRRLDAALGAGPVRAELAGGYVSAAATASAMRKDMISQTVLSSILVMGFLTWITRSALAPPLLLVPVVLSIVCGLAFGGAILGPLTPLVVSVTAVLVAQPIDFSLHFFERFRSERRAHPGDAAVVRSQDSLTRPFAGAAAATMSAFALLLTSRFPGFVHFGFLLLLGMVALLLSSLTLFPVLLRASGRFIRPAEDRPPLLVGALVRLSEGRLRLPLAALLAALGLAAWSSVALGRVRIDLDVRNMMAPGDPGQAVLDGLERDLGASMNPVVAVLPPDAAPDGVARLLASGAARFADGAQELAPSPARLARVERFRHETEGWVEGALRDFAAAGFKPDALRPSLEGFQAVFSAAPPLLEDPAFAALRSQFIYEGRPVAYLFPPKALWRPAERAVFDAEVRAALGAEVRLYSGFHLPDHYAKLLTADLLKVAGWTAVAVVLITLLAVGSLADGLRALLPAFVGTGVTLAACVFLGGAINLMNMVAVPIILGTGVDGGIQFVARLRENGRDPRAALRDVAAGVWGSAVTTLLGFGAIGSSATPGLSSMGLLVVVGTLAALATTFFVIPALFASSSHPQVPLPGRGRG